MENQVNFLEPEAAVMLAIAVMLDILGVICAILIFVFGVGAALSYIPDVLGTIIIGGWILTRGGMKFISRRRAIRKAKTAIEIAKTASRAAKTSVRIMRVVDIVSEYIPVLGVLPCWTLQVYLELRYM